ncbi:MAG: SRPBCC family protein [Chloroflexi bacterium]|nr:SRPBCC family protein [Chloroflexota bacterium]
MDIVREIEAIERQVGSGRIAAGEGRVIRLQRTYEAPIEEVWDALTNHERISRWFLPISGDYRVGGRYQLEDNAGGEILACERPHRLRVTWVYGETASAADVSEVELRLTTTGDEATTLELEHTAIVPDEFWSQYGPGAVGVGWEMGLLGLSLHLRGGSIEDPIAWQLSDEGRDFATRSSHGWGAAHAAAGASPEAVAMAVTNTTVFYTVGPTAASPDGAGE